MLGGAAVQRACWGGWSLAVPCVAVAAVPSRFGLLRSNPPPAPARAPPPPPLPPPGCQSESNVVEALFPLFELLHHYWINQADRDSCLQQLGRLLSPAVFGTPAEHGLPAEDGGLLSDTGERAQPRLGARAAAGAAAGQRVSNTGRLVRSVKLRGPWCAACAPAPQPKRPPSRVPSNARHACCS